jgi:hypothetical protein
LFEYTLSYDELGLAETHVASGLGYRDTEPSPEIRALMREVLDSAGLHCEVRGGLRVLEECAVDNDRSGLSLGSVRLATGKVVASQMRGSVSAAVFVATAGPKFEAWSKRLIEEGELVLGYMVDAAASEAAERAMDLIQEHFAGWIKERGLRVTNRFSPGYCGWPVSDQHALFSLLPERFCGVALTPSSLMVPIKSVSGLIGIGPGVRFHPYPCRWCELKNCYKRRTR